MPNRNDACRAIIWADATRLPLVESVLGRLPAVSVEAVGGPRRGDLTGLAKSFGIESVDDDLRQMLINRTGAYLVLATQQGVKRDDLALALESSIDVLSFEPIAGRGDPALVHDRSRPAAGRLIQAPLWRLSPGFLAATDPKQALGVVRSASLSSIGQPGAGSLFARLVDLFDMAIALIGIPDSIDAALAGPLTQPPDDVRGLTGHLSLNLHYVENATVSAQASDRAAINRRTMTVVGETGVLLLDDYRYRLFTAEGEMLDEAAEAIAGPADLAELVAEQWRCMMARKPASAGPDYRAVLGCCETALLSTRTGQAEATETLVRMKL